MKDKRNKLEKFAYMNFTNPDSYFPVYIVLNDGKTIKGEIIKDYTYDIIVDRHTKDKEGNEYLQEMLIPKHSISYLYHRVKK
ncbi:hypothetical protein [Staphylococcus sp. Marseille-Q6910]|uniref:hypothetical protein n=1 Tax=Staphylococcus sp. Marseille-Q6910 TaxID=2937990 RepID=UPI002041C07C|nr:hypothetical protein [Staphylococcus sp. Marseille-Q6910]